MRSAAGRCDASQSRASWHALRNIHAALAPDTLLVDTQPISAQPRVGTEDAELGRLDVRAWLDTIHAIDEQFAKTIAAGLYDLQHERHFIVTESFGTGRARAASLAA